MSNIKRAIELGLIEADVEFFSNEHEIAYFQHKPNDVTTPSFYFYHNIDSSNVEALKGLFGEFVQPHGDGELDVKFPHWLNFLMHIPRLGYEA